MIVRAYAVLAAEANTKDALAWKGRVVQYVGRLLRTHDGKHDVEVHDYVDSLVPVLARMHTKRLAGYAALGFDVRLARRAQRL